MKKENLSLITSIAALLLALGAFLTVVSFGGNLCAVNGSELAVGLIAVCATIIVGFQIYNTVDSRSQLDAVKQKIEKIEELQTSSNALQETIHKSEASMLANQIIDDAESIYYDASHHYREASPEFALIKILDAIIPAMDADWRGAAYDRLFHAMDAYIDRVGQSGIIEYCKRTDKSNCDVQYTVYRFDLDIRAKTNSIQSHKNYHFVQKDYEVRLNNIELKLAEARIVQ